MNETLGCFDPRIKNSYYEFNACNVYIMIVQHLIRVENLSSACVMGLAFADFRFIFFVPLCDCRSAAATPQLEASHLA